MVNREKTIKPDVFDEVKSRQKLYGGRKVEKVLIESVCKIHEAFWCSWVTPWDHLGVQVSSEVEVAPGWARPAYRVKAQDSLLRLRTSMHFEINRVHTEPGSSRGAQELAKTVLGEEKC